MNETSAHNPPPLAETENRATSRRVFERLNLDVEVDVASDHNFYTTFSSNLSAGGIFIATHILRPVGTVLEIRFTLPGDDEPIVAIADVRWSRLMNERSDAPPGLGLRFLRIDERALYRISSFVEAMREPLFYED